MPVKQLVSKSVIHSGLNINIGIIRDQEVFIIEIMPEVRLGPEAQPRDANN